ncbi:hypothetical protein JB92DRAFT_3015540, partial [Gautieria morchelliformis]
MDEVTILRWLSFRSPLALNAPSHRYFACRSLASPRLEPANCSTVAALSLPPTLLACTLFTKTLSFPRILVIDEFYAAVVPLPATSQI